MLEKKEENLKAPIRQTKEDSAEAEKEHKVLQKTAEGTVVDEDRYLAVVLLALAVIACALCCITCILTVLVHKLSALWVKALVRPTPVESEASEARKGLLQDVKSSLATPSSKAEGKKKKASFAEDTSCAAPRDVDEEDL